MRVVRVRVSTFWLEQIFRGHEYCEIVTDWPKDAEIIHSDWDASTQQIMLNVTSASFDEVPDMAIIPEWSPTITLNMDENAQLLNLVRRNMKDEATTS